MTVAERIEKWLPLCWLVGAAGVCFLLYRSVIAPSGEVDFRFFWLAGHMWATGLDPFSLAYPDVAARVLPPGNETPLWVYPPHWWPICRVLAEFSLNHAVMLWRVLAGLLIWLGSWIVVAHLIVGDRRTLLGMTALVGGVASLIEPTANLLALGQTGGLLFLGICLLAAGVAKDRLWMVGASALILSLKPQLGLPVLLALMVVPRFRVPVLAAGLVGLILCVPQFLGHGVATTMQEWLRNLGHYNDHVGEFDTGANSVLSCTGPLHLLARLFPIHPNPMLQLGLALAVSLVGGWMIRARETVLSGLLLLLVAVVSLLPLHIYDFAMIIVPLTLLFAMKGRATWPMVVIVALVIRPARIENLLHVPVYGNGVSAGTIGLSLAGMLLLAVAVAQIARGIPLRR